MLHVDLAFQMIQVFRPLPVKIKNGLWTESWHRANIAKLGEPSELDELGEVNLNVGRHNML